MPFGLTNAPASFQSYINDVLSSMLGTYVAAYLDDILIFSDTLEAHVTHVQNVLAALEAANLYANLSKCEFHSSSVEFLGFVISPNGIQMAADKLSAIKEWPTPQSMNDVQIFLGFANFYRRFIQNYSKRTLPLTSLLQKDAPFQWTNLTQDCFDSLKSTFLSSPVLQTYDPSQPCIIETDASDFAIGAVLSQPSSLKPVSFISRKLSPAEINYPVHDKELLAIIYAMSQWRAWVQGLQKDVMIYSDHKNLEYFTTTKPLNRRQVRWSEFLADFHFRIVYRPGRSNGAADALSRRTDLKGGDATEPPLPLLPAEIFMTERDFRLAASSVCSDPIDEELLQKIKQAQSVDPKCKSSTVQAQQSSNTSDFSLHDGLLLYDGRVYIPENEELKYLLLRTHHDDPVAGHYGEMKTLELVSRDYYWPSLRRFVKRYIQTCEVCQVTKASRQPPHGELRSLPIPSGPWRSISADFIMPLSVSDGFDAVLVVVDRFTKYAHFIATQSSINSTQSAELLHRHVFVQHGLPDSFVSDRDPRFVSHVWQRLHSLLGISKAMSTAYRPQTDGQTERTNQTLEQYLRCYCMLQPERWAEYLPMAQFTYNNTFHSSINATPFFANYGYHPKFTVKPINRTINQSAENILINLETVHLQLKHQLAKALESQAKYYNKHHQATPEFNEGEKVLLRIPGLERGANSKFRPLRYGPYTIVKKLSSHAFRIELPHSLKKLHPVFHVSLLTKYNHDDTAFRASPSVRADIEPPSPPVPVSYIPKEISAHRGPPEAREYFVLWEDLDPVEDTWVPASDLTEFPQVIIRFHRQLERLPGSQS